MAAVIALAVRHKLRIVTVKTCFGICVSRSRHIEYCVNLRKKQQNMASFRHFDYILFSRYLLHTCGCSTLRSLSGVKSNSIQCIFIVVFNRGISPLTLGFVWVTRDCKIFQ